jgi:hypothetical protein
MKCYSGGNVGHFWTWTTFPESKTVHVPVVYITWGLIILIAGKTISRVIGKGGSKKTRFSGPTPSNGPTNEFVPFIFMSNVKLFKKKQAYW